MEFTDKLLIIFIKQGNTKAFELLFNRYHKKLYHFTFSLLRSKEEAEEVVQDVFAKLWEMRHELDESVSYGGYLYKATRNMSLNILRKKINARYYSESIIRDLSNPANLTYSSVDHNELNEFYKKALLKVPEKRKRIFLLSREEGMSYKEIAAELNISVNTVDTQIRRTLEYLRERLRDFRR